MKTYCLKCESTHDPLSSCSSMHKLKLSKNLQTLAPKSKPIHPNQKHHSREIASQSLKISPNMSKNQYIPLSYTTNANSDFYTEQLITNTRQGHGFAAEKANHLYDRLTGKDAELVGGDNLKNGADRLVNGYQIQSKYCSTGRQCINECFKDGNFRYLNADGSPMQIEVPSDMYEQALETMKEKIRNGKIPKVSDPAQAKEIVKKGHFSYNQAKNIARFGTIESLSYDAVRGVEIGLKGGAISAAIVFAKAIWDGKSVSDALKLAAQSGLEVFGISFLTSVLSSQISKTGAELALRTSTDWMVSQIGSKATSNLVNLFRTSGTEIYGRAAANHLSKVLRSNFVTGLIVTTVLSLNDFRHMFNGNMSFAQVFKNFTKTGASVAGGTIGWSTGASVGASLGSIVPGVGTVIGGFIGGGIGAIFGGYAGGEVSSLILDELIEDDAKKMLEKLQDIFAALASDYLLSEQEAQIILHHFKEINMAEFLRNMYQDQDFAHEFLEKKCEEIAKNRNFVLLPSPTEYARTIGEDLNQQS